MQHQRRYRCRSALVGPRCLSRPGHRFQWGLSRRPPARVSTASRIAIWPGAPSGSRQTCPKTAARRLRMWLVRSSYSVWLVTSALVTKWNQQILRMCRWHDMWNASSFHSSDFSMVHVSHPYRGTERTSELKTLNLVARLSLDCCHTMDNLPMMPEAIPIWQCISRVDQPSELIALPRYRNWSTASNVCPQTTHHITPNVQCTTCATQMALQTYLSR